MLSDPAPENECYWPHDQRYASVCMHCEEIFYGPNRAPSCWKRQSPEVQSWWRSKFETVLKEGE